MGAARVIIWQDPGIRQHKAPWITAAGSRRCPGNRLMESGTRSPQDRVIIRAC